MACKLDFAFLATLLLLLTQSCSTSQTANRTEPDAASTGSTQVFLDAGPTTAVPPDGGSSCPPASCNYQTQQGCLAGQMCHPVLNTSSVSPECVDAGTSTASEACAWQQCQAGLFCGANGQCQRLCCGGDWSVCAVGETCSTEILLQLGDAGTPIPSGVRVCEPTDNCDVFAATTCPTGKSCYIVDSRGGTKCLTTGTVPFNGSCAATQRCAPGFTCVQSSASTAGNCRRLCRAVLGGAEPFCPQSEGYCAHFVHDPAGVGECTPVLQ